MWNYVVDQANRVSYRADNFEGHPTYDTVAAIKTSATEVHGMYRMALDMNELQHDERARAAINFMDKTIMELVSSRRRSSK